ncbi:hypothetical protein BJV78DRAFT_16362 [Lactifluus subvellereus]|nr:hypothetical protein BJV78DRAFT_16362 [Lactifluus subvellereus]
MSCTSSSTLSHQGSGVTSDSSVSSPLLSPIISGPQLSRLTVDTGRILGRELFPSSPVSPQSIQRDWDDRSPIVASPSSATLRDVSKTRSSGFTDAGPSTPSGTGSLASHRKVSSAYTLNGAPGPRVIIRQPSSSSSHPLRPLTSPPASELPPAPEGVRRDDFSLLPAFSERTAHSAASSSSSLSFASSASSRFDPLEAEGHRRYMRRLKDGKKSVRSRPPSPSKDTSRDVQDTPSKPSSSRREFSPTRTLKKAISIQNLPKKSQGSSLSSPSLPAAEDTKPLKKHRSFHHTHIPVPHIPVPPLPASLKQAGSSTLPSGRDAISVPEERKTSVQAAQKSPLSSPVLNPMYVRRRLFSGTSLRRSTSSHTPEPEDDTQSILSLSPTASPLAPHTAIPLLQPSVSNNPELSSFWDEESPVILPLAMNHEDMCQSISCQLRTFSSSRTWFETAKTSMDLSVRVGIHSPHLRLGNNLRAPPPVQRHQPGPFHPLPQRDIQNPWGNKRQVPRIRSVKDTRHFTKRKAGRRHGWPSSDCCSLSRTDARLILPVAHCFAWPPTPPSHTRKTVNILRNQFLHD